MPMIGNGGVYVGNATRGKAGAQGVPPNWITVADFNFQTATGVPSLATNGAKTFGGFTWQRENAAGDASAMTCTSVGLRITPANATNYGFGARNAPLLRLPFSQLPLLTNLSWASPFRVFVAYTITGYAAGSGTADLGAIALENGTAVCLQTRFGQNGALGDVGITTCGSYGANPAGNECGEVKTLDASNNGLITVFDRGLAPRIFPSFGAYVASFPVNPTPLACNGGLVNNGNGMPLSGAGQPSALSIAFVGVRNAANPVVTFLRFRLDYIPVP